MSSVIYSNLHFTLIILHALTPSPLFIRSSHTLPPSHPPPFTPSPLHTLHLSHPHTLSPSHFHPSHPLPFTLSPITPSHHHPPHPLPFTLSALSPSHLTPSHPLPFTPSHRHTLPLHNLTLHPLSFTAPQNTHAGLEGRDEQRPLRELPLPEARGCSQHAGPREISGPFQVPPFPRKTSPWSVCACE